MGTELESLKEENEARSVDYDVELRKKDCRIRDLEAAMSDMKEKHRAEMKDLNDSNKAMVAKTKKLAIDKEKDTGEMKQRLEQKKRAEVTEEEQEWQSFKTPSFREAHPKKAEATKPLPRSYLARGAAEESSKRKLIDSSTSDDEGKLFEDFFNKPKKTYTSKTPERRAKKFFTHKRGPPPPSF